MPCQRFEVNGKETQVNDTHGGGKMGGRRPFLL